MELSTADKYYMKALDCYPHDLESVMESLEYALAYNDGHAPSLCLMGRLLMYVMKDYKKARSYFDEAMRSDHRYPDTYEYLGQLYIWIGRYDMAEKVISYSFKIAGVDHGTMLRLRSSVAEYRGRYAAAKQLLKQAKVLANPRTCIYTIDQDIKRIKVKSKLLGMNKKSKRGKKKAK